MSTTQTDQLSFQQQQITPPKKYGVFLLNDDYTPMDFVVALLCEVFMLPESRAEAVMLEVHHQGKGLAGSYTRDIAQTKQQQVLAIAAGEGFPLMCTVEELS